MSLTSGRYRIDGAARRWARHSHSVYNVVRFEHVLSCGRLARFARERQAYNKIQADFSV